MRLYLALLFSCFTITKGTCFIFTVSNSNSTGAGSLRQAITDANALAGLDTINFNASYSIVLASALPVVTSPVFINGGNIPSPQIEINGNTNSIVGAGIQLAATAAGSTIKGLNIHGMQWQGILIGASNTTVLGCYIGTNFSGALPSPNSFAGIEVSPGLSNIKIGGSSPDSMNLISGNGRMGITIGAGCSNIKISGNRVGTNATGIAALPNSQHGIMITSSSSVTLGGNVNERNIISGNLQHGVLFNSCTNVKISNNYIGTNATGLASIPNGISGIQLTQTTGRVGGLTADSSNVVSGNTERGIDIITSSNVLVIGNLIGIGANGNTAIGNGRHGIQLVECNNIRVGGASSAEKNVIGSNNSHGILIDNGDNIIVTGNFIGTDKTGLLKRGNSSHGIQLQTSASNIRIGGSRYVEGNILSCNSGAGINFEAPASGKLSASGTIIKGNLIGTDSTGLQDFGNGVIGLILKADNCIIGDTANNEGNVIGGTDLFCGLLIANGNNNIVQGNFIGVATNGSTAIANKQDGVLIAIENSGQTANANIVRYNTIAYNGRYGINVGKPLNGFISNNERGNVLRFNKIYCNTSLGIFLNLAVATDYGNNGQIAPRIDFFLTDANVIYGVTIPGLAGQKIDLYQVVDCPNCDINPQGKIWIDSVTINGSGAWSYDYFAKFGTIIPGQVVATVTDNAGNTSQFSTCCKAISGVSLVPSANPVCLGVSFSIRYSNGQEGDSLMLQTTTDTISGTWTNVAAKLLVDPITFSNLTISDTSFFRFITYSQGTYTTAACKDSSKIIRVDLAPVAVAGVASLTPDTICVGATTDLLLTGSTGNIQWERSLGGAAFSSITGASNTTYTDTPPYQNPVLYRAKVSRSICPDAYSNTVQVVVGKANAGIISGDHNPCRDVPTSLSLTGSVGNLQWQEFSTTGWQNISPGTHAQINFTPDSTHLIRVVVVDVTGKCFDTTSVFEMISRLCTSAQPVEIPNALTPNGDGSNDVFYINKIWLYPNNKLYIYNRWGNKVYEQSGYINEWDGTCNGEKLPGATYYYVLDLGEDINGNKNDKDQYTGFVVIVR